MSDLNLFHGPNAGYALELYERYRQDPNSVDAATRALFDTQNPDAPAIVFNTFPAAAPTVPATSSPKTIPQTDIVRISAAAARLARFIRERGHLGADTDPLDISPRHDTDLELSAHNITTDDLMTLPSSVVGGPLADASKNALEVIGELRQAYSGSIGYDDEHIQNNEERYWLREVAESRCFFNGFDAARKRELLERLTEVDTFEQYLHTAEQGAKRFSIEGTDTLVPMLDEILRLAAETETKELVLGMAHRGRLNVLAHVLGKPYAAILAEFAHARVEEDASVSGKGTQGWSGDVKYHLGHRRAYNDSGAREMAITLCPNPSHLEFVNPVVEGHARAAQERRDRPGEPEQNEKACLPIAIHGDSAFPGQGIVAETLNLSGLAGYRTGGTIHIIVNNQIGFTTLPSDARSTTYASDLAKGFEIPIVHVNADDPIACIAAARMAHAYRERFHKDFLIDLIGYRRYGHNEGDAPEYTQPRMYEIIQKHLRVREKWATELEKQGIVTSDEAAAMVTTMMEKLKAARNAPMDARPAAGSFALDSWRNPIETGVPAEQLLELNEALLARPTGFTPNAKLERIVFARRRTGITAEGGIDWGHAETLALASILADGTPIRLTGQDAERGTFSTRHLVLHDPTDGDRIVPLQHLPAARASFAVYNSPLSENAALGFEYGYNIHAPGALVLWEAQFGDFTNGAQVILDQFLTSGHAKWQQTPSLVLLLPHGYEGQGPEHSSARLERFLQLAANDNLRIVNCTTAAQYFHLLRRQAALLNSDPRPLIVMTPKYLLRHPRANASLAELASGTFQPVIDDASARTRAEEITRLVLCSGKVYVDFVYEAPGAAAAAPAPRAAFARAERVAAVRVEQLYPFPTAELEAVLAGYPNLREIVWLQEEPRNMGAWSFVAPLLRDLVGWGGALRYAGRPEAASPAEGSVGRHESEQAYLLASALEGVPVLPDLSEPPVALPHGERMEAERDGEAERMEAEPVSSGSPSRGRRA